MIASFVGAFVLASAAPDFVWRPLYEPGCGGAIVSLEVSPHDSNHLVSGGDMLGTAVSFDAGELWAPGLGLPAYEMATPTFHPERADDVWIGSCMGPFLSKDGGRTWQWRRNGMPERSRGRYSVPVEKILIDPVCSERLIAFGGSSRRWSNLSPQTMGAIWLSEDYGSNWRRAGTIAEDGFTADAVPGANIVKAWWGAEQKPCAHLLADGVGWFSSHDGGRTWRRRKTGGLPRIPSGITTHPSDSNVVWAAVPPGPVGPDGRREPGSIWKSADAGRTFVPCDEGVTKSTRADLNFVTRFSDIAVSPVPPYRLYVSDMGWATQAIWVSDDGGAAWRKGCGKESLRTACFAGPGCRIAPSSTEPEVAYAYNSEYVLKTADGGRTWTDATAFRPDSSKPEHWRGRGWSGWCSRAVTFNPYRRGQSVVQAMDAARGWVSDDGFRSWRYAHGGVGPWSGGVAAAFSRDGSIYLTTGQGGFNNGIVYSHDGGKTWASAFGAKRGLPERADGVYGGVWADGDDGNHAFAVFHTNRYVTVDGGLSWRRETPAETGRFVVDPVNSKRFYIKNSNGVFSTEDWKSFRWMGLPGISEGDIACDRLGRVLVCRGRIGDKTSRGLWRLDPREGDWRRLHGDSLACAVAVDPFDQRRIVMTTADHPYHDFSGGNGVYVSDDDGVTWHQMDKGLHVRRLTCVAFDPFDGETIVAGTTGGGFVVAKWPRR